MKNRIIYIVMLALILAGVLLAVGTLTGIVDRPDPLPLEEEQAEDEAQERADQVEAEIVEPVGQPEAAVPTEDIGVD